MTLRYAHIRTENGPKGGFTLAYNDLKNGVVEYAVARCHPKDNFNKFLGRQIAMNRFVNGITHSAQVPNSEKNADIVNACVTREIARREAVVSKYKK